MNEIFKTYQVTMNMVEKERKHITRYTFLSYGIKAQAGLCVCSPL